MPATRHIYNSFNAGEVSPKIEARTDLEKYANACNTLENMCILPQGGVTGRPGTRYVGSAKYPDKKSRLIPFEYSVDDAYVLEFGHNYIRPYKNGARASAATEKINNGTFDTGTSGWTECSGLGPPSETFNEPGSHVFWNSVDKAIILGTWVILNPDVVYGLGRVYQAINTVVGRTYTVSISSVRGGSTIVKVGTSLHNSEYLYGIISPTYNATFVATAETAYVELEYYSGPCNVDMVSVIEDAVSVEIGTTYTEAQLPDIKYAQSADVLYITHPSHPVRKLMRYSAGDWRLEDVLFSPPPTRERDVNLTADTISITLNATSGTGKTATASSGTPFMESDVGRQLKYRNGVATIIAPFNNSVANIDITETFPTANLPAGTLGWKLSGTPYTTLTPGAVGPVGSIVTLTLGANGFRLADLGKYVRGNSGYAKIVEYTSLTAVKAVVMVAFANTNSIVEGAWSLEETDWSTLDGYPGAVCFFEQRLFLAGSGKYPTTIWASVTGDYENFKSGTSDDDSLSYMIASNLVNTVRWMVPTRALLIGTAGGEFRAQGGAESPLTPSNVDIKSETTHGSNRMVPVRIGNNVLYFQRSSRKLRDFLYEIQTDGYTSSDLTILSDHVTEGGAVDMDYEQEPLSQVWVARADGVLLSVTYVKGESVVGWSRHILGGEVESVATIPSPSGSGDQTWLVVKRTIDGSSVRYLECLDWDLCTDCSILQNNAVASASVTGLSHLEGELVRVVADGEYAGEYTVTSGAITLDVSALEVQVGLAFTPKLVTARPETAQATVQGAKKRWSECFVRVQETRGVSINGQPQEDASAVTADIRVVNLGYDRSGRITIQQNYPYPVTILSVFGTLLVED